MNNLTYYSGLASGAALIITGIWPYGGFAFASVVVGLLLILIVFDARLSM